MTRNKWLRPIAGYKIVKGLLLLSASAGLLTMVHHDIAAVLEQGASVLHADPHNHVVHGLIATIGLMDVKTLEELGVGTLAYASLTLTEGVGLWLAMRWAAYLAVVATGIFVPVEVYTLIQQFTFVKGIILAINIAIVWYLVAHLQTERGQRSEAALQP